MGNECWPVRIVAAAFSKLSWSMLLLSVLPWLLLIGFCGCNNTSSLTASTLVAPVAAEPQDRSSFGEDWPAFLGPRGDGTSSEVGIDPQIWKPHPPLRWSVKLGTSYGSPAIVGNRLLQFDRFGNDERLTCYDASTGQEIWQWNSPVQYSDSYGYNNGPRCSPIVDGDYVFTYGVAGQLSCVHLTTGQPVWSKDLASEYTVIQNFFGVASNPYVYKDLLLVMVGGSPKEALEIPRSRLDLVQPNGTAIVAFDKRTGEERYRLGNDLASYSSVTVRQIEGRLVGLAFLRGGLIAFDPDRGQQLFQYPWRADKFESVNAAVPITTDNNILLSECYEIGSVLLEVRDNQPVVLRQDQGSLRDLSFRAHWATPVLIDGYLYGCSGRNTPDCDFRCVRFYDGEVQWTKKPRPGERSSVLFADDHLIILGEKGTLQLVRPSPDEQIVLAEADLSELRDPVDGSKLIQAPCWAAPVLSHGLLYIRGRDRLLCFDLIPFTD